jgi:large subunit ribosomal protein L24
MPEKKIPARHQNKPRPRVNVKIKRDDSVKVISGRDKGKTGRVLMVDRERGRVLVEGVGLVKRHTRPNPQRQIKGGIAERESAIHISNVMLMTSGGQATRVGYRLEGARRVRIAKKTGEIIDKKG